MNAIVPVERILANVNTSPKFLIKGVCCAQLLLVRKIVEDSQEIELAGT